jgi:predicted nucleic acid-binding protein
MKITADTNVLPQACVADDPAQAQKAVEALESAERVVIGQQSFCELAWVLGRHYSAVSNFVCMNMPDDTQATSDCVIARPAGPRNDDDLILVFLYY